MSLGRGLGALITPAAKNKKEDQGSSEKIWQIPISSITPNPHQPRKTFDQAELEDLSASIKEHGVLQPLLVTEKTDGGYELVAGERRLKASQLAGLATVPAIIKKLADRQKLEVALIENVQREDLNAIEEGFAYKRLMEEFGLSVQDVAAKVGKSRPQVSNSMRMLELPEEVKEALFSKKISRTQARALLSLPEKKQQVEMLRRILGEKIPVNELERITSRQSKQGHRDPNLIFLEDKLRDLLGTKVLITKTGERGRIIIEYFSQEELSKLVKKILQ